MFRPDQPIQSGSEDLLGRQAFSNALANAICSYQDKNSIVVGLYGLTKKEIEIVEKSGER